MYTTRQKGTFLGLCKLTERECTRQDRKELFWGCVSLQSENVHDKTENNFSGVV